jgi:two-component system chemotaxis response regulator CheY
MQTEIRKATVLIIDDETGIQDVFVFLLEPMGYEVLRASDGVEGLQMLENRRVDVIFLDIHMPRLNGVEVLRRIREKNPAQRVIVMSSSSDPSGSAENEAKKLRATFVVEKPIGADDIIALLEESDNSRSLPQTL